MPEGVKAEAHVAHGSIYDEILRLADKLGCDAIVMAAHRPELRDYLLGPNASRVVRHAKQSVLVVRD
jgi:nucleotide-binding universal stress UspA family protein